MDRCQAEIRDRERDGRSRRDRAALDGAVAATGGDVVRLDRDLLGGPRPPLRQRLVLEHDSAALEHEVIDGHVAPTPRAPGALHEVGEVERVGGQAHDADGGAVEHEVANPQMTAQQRQELEADVEPIEVGERALAVTLREPETVHGEAPGEYVAHDAVDVHRPSRHRVDARDRDAANHLGQRPEPHPERNDEDKGAEEQPSASAHRAHRPSPGTSHTRGSISCASETNGIRTPRRNL